MVCHSHHDKTLQGCMGFQTVNWCCSWMSCRPTQGWPSWWPFSHQSRKGQVIEMPKFKRKWTCGHCDGEVIYDARQHTLTCKCGVVHLPRRLPTMDRLENYVRLTAWRDLYDAHTHESLSFQDKSDACFSPHASNGSGLDLTVGVHLSIMVKPCMQTKPPSALSTGSRCTRSAKPHTFAPKKTVQLDS